jgi:hypothetical protein
MMWGMEKYVCMLCVILMENVWRIQVFYIALVVTHAYKARHDSDAKILPFTGV